MTSYRTRFAGPELAQRYEDTIFADDSYGTLLTSIEIAFVDDVRRRLACGAPRYLDFACGTGRILAKLEPVMASSTGIDVSDAMLEVAATRVSKSRLIAADITADGSAVEQRYDLITAFRFFLNAEEDLRRRVMPQLAARLADENSRLVFNVHSTPSSYRGLLWLAAAARARVTGRASSVRVLSHAHVLDLAHEAGLEVEEVYGYGVLSGHMLAPLGSGRVLGVERSLAGSRTAAWLGSSRLYVARLRRG